MTFSRRLDLPALAILLAMALGSLWGWLTIDGPIPLHWNIDGEVDRTTGKPAGLLLLPAITLGVYLLIRFLPHVDRERRGTLTNNLGYSLLLTTALLFLAAVHLLVLLTARGYDISVSVVIPIALGIVFIVIGVALPRLPPNRFAGIRTPWTMASEDVWTRTHATGGPVFVVAGIVVMLAAALSGGAQVGVILAAVMLPSVALTFYSWWVWREYAQGRF